MLNKVITPNNEHILNFDTSFIKQRVKIIPIPIT